ncbi:unnamed protein product [Phaeothamnion confervicola]
MKTRTLLLLAIGCGLAILLAGGVFLLRLSSDPGGTKALGIGDVGRAGDATVTLLAFQSDATTLVVDVRLGGVDDPEGVGGFTLVAPGKVVTATDDSTCTAIAVAPTECTLVFDTTGLDGSSRQLLFRRADTQLRWSLAAA